MARVALGVLLALAAVASGQDENMTGMAPPKAQEPAAPVASAAVAAPVSAAAALPALTRDLDAIFSRAWKEAGVAPAPDAPPGELVRRVYLDLAGRTPTAAEAREFIGSTDPARLPQLVERLLASREFAEHVADGFTVVLLGREANVDALNRKQFRDWLASRIEEDAPLDSVSREILGAKTDSVVKNPAGQYMVLFGGDPSVIAGRTARIFLGNRIACAQCHDHPYEPWKRTDFWSLAAYFQRVRRDPIYEPQTDEMRKKKIQQRVVDWRVYEADGGDTYIPLQNGETGRPALALPRFLGGTYDLTLHGTKEPRLPSLANAVTVEKRRELARAFANRFFALLFGRGVIHPVDDFSEGRMPLIPEALDRITTGFEEGGLRLHGYIRALALTQAYSRSSTGTPARGAGGTESPHAAVGSDANLPGGSGYAAAGAPEKIDARDKTSWTKTVREDPALDLFARMRHKPLSPEQALRAFVTASRAEESAREQGEKPLAQWHQQQQGILGQFVGLMARHDEEDPHSVQEGIPQALVLMNGPSVAFFCQPRPGTTVGLAAKEKDAKARVESLYMAAFSRAPARKELEEALAFFDKKDPAKATEDYFWSLVNSSEFLYNH